MPQEPLTTWGLIQYAWANWDQIQNAWILVLAAFWALVGAVVNLASFITPFTKTPQDDKIVEKLKGWMHQFSVTNPKQ